MFPNEHSREFENDNGEQEGSFHLPSIHTFIQSSSSGVSPPSNHHSYPSPHYPFTSPFLSAHNNTTNSSRPRSQDSLMSLSNNSLHSNNVSPNFQYHQFSHHDNNNLHLHHNQQQQQQQHYQSNNHMEDESPTMSSSSTTTSSFSNHNPSNNMILSTSNQQQQQQHRTQRSNSSLLNQLNRKAVITPNGINMPPSLSSTTCYPTMQSTQPIGTYIQNNNSNNSSNGSSTSTSLQTGNSFTYSQHHQVHTPNNMNVVGNSYHQTNSGVSAGGAFYQQQQQQPSTSTTVHHQPLNAHVVIQNSATNNSSYYNQGGNNVDYFQNNQQHYPPLPPKPSRPVPVSNLSFSGSVNKDYNSSINPTSINTNTATITNINNNINNNLNNVNNGQVMTNQFGINPLPWDNNSKTIRSFSNFQPKPPKKTKTSVKQCENPKCNATDTPLWRKGYFVEGGRRANLCNACGLHYRKGHFCKFCNEIYRDVNELVSTEPWILCCACERYMHRKCVQQAGITLPKSQSHQHISQSVNDQFYCDECGGARSSPSVAKPNINTNNIVTSTNSEENSPAIEKMDETSFETSPILNAIANSSTSPPKTSGSRPLSFQAPPSTTPVRVATRPFTVSADRENVVSLLMRHNETTMGMMNAPNPFVNNAASIEGESENQSPGLNNYYNLKNRPLPPIPSKVFSEQEQTSVNATNPNMREGNALPSINFLLTPPKD